MDEVAKQLAELARQYGPGVWDAAQAAVRVEMWSTVVYNGLGLVVAAACASAGALTFNKVVKEDGTDDSRDDLGLFGLILLFIGTIWGIVCVVNLVDPWLWTAMARPELWLAKRALKL